MTSNLSSSCSVQALDRVGTWVPSNDFSHGHILVFLSYNTIYSITLYTSPFVSFLRRGRGEYLYRSVDFLVPRGNYILGHLF